MASDPWFLLFPAVGALVFAGLTVGLFLRREALGGMAPTWIVAFAFGALGFVGALAAGVVNWSNAADFVAAYSGAAAAVAFAAAFSGLFQRYARGWVGAPAFRWLLFAAALGLEGFGWGALAASPGPLVAPGDGVPAPWVVVPAAAGLLVLVPLAVLASRDTLPRAGLMNTVQFALGTALLAASWVVFPLGDLLMGSVLGMTGGAFLYSGTSAIAGKAPAAAAPAVRPRVEKPEGAPSRAATGVKVRIPKGAAQRVSSFRDDDRISDESK